MTNAWLAAGLGAVVVLDIALLWIVLGPALARRLDERNAARHDGAAGGGALDIRAIAALDPSSVLGDGVPVRGLRPGRPRRQLGVPPLDGGRRLRDRALAGGGGPAPPRAGDRRRLHPRSPTTSCRPPASGRRRFVVEGAVAITLVSIVVALTGGAASPFFYAYPLVVAGAALVVRPARDRRPRGGARSPATSWPWPGRRRRRAAPDTGSLAIVAVNLTALVLLAYVAMVVAREQRRTRDAAVRLSTIDALTGLANRGYIIAAARARDRPGHAVPARLLPADGRPRRAQGAQRHATATGWATGPWRPWPA